MGLAASQQAARGVTARLELRQQARRAARIGLDAALARLSAAAADSIASSQGEGVVEEGAASSRYRFAAAAAPADSVYGDAKTPVYGGGFLRHRPGDALVTVRATARRGGAALELEHIYLVNAGPDAPRRVRFSEEVRAAK